MEGVYHILKQNGFSFVKHDFNESQNGKDHCDRESAVAQHCRTVYINAGHNIQTVEDIKNSLLYMNWVKNAKVSVVEIDSSVNEIKSQKNYNISNYHSAGNYDSVGKGIVVEKKCVEFTSGLNVVTDLKKLAQIIMVHHVNTKNPDLIAWVMIIFCTVLSVIVWNLSEWSSIRESCVT